MISVLIWCATAMASPTGEHLDAGITAQRSGAVELALEHYRKCLEIDPDHVRCNWEIGWSYWTRGNWEQVVSHWRRVKALQPDHPEVDPHLATAQGHLDGLQRIRDSAKGAPQTVRPPAPEGWTLRIRAVGDIMMGTDFPDPTRDLPPEDGATLFADVRDLLRDADLTFGNLEGPLCDGGQTRKCKDGGNCYAFRTPTRYGPYLVDAGFDVLSTANNHAEDFGSHCRTETETTLQGLGIAFSGRPGTVASLEHDGRRIALIGFHTSRNSHYVNDHATAAELVKALDASHDLVLVSFHGGAEGNAALHVPDGKEVFYGENRGHLRAFARVLVDAGADLVLGHGPHVPRGLQILDGRLVAYSLGNFATYGRFGLDRHLATSLILEVVLDAEGQILHGQILPVRLRDRGIPFRDPDGTAVDLVRELSTADFGASAPVIGQDGSFAPKRTD